MESKEDGEARVRELRCWAYMMRLQNSRDGASSSGRTRYEAFGNTVNGRRTRRVPEVGEEIIILH